MEDKMKLIVKRILAVTVIFGGFSGVFGTESFALGKAKPTPEPVPTAAPVPAPVPIPPPASAVPEIKLGEITAGGTGCPEGFLLSEVAFDHLTVRVRFNHFTAVIDESRNLDRKNCSVAIPVLDGAPGKRLVVSRIILSGSQDFGESAGGRLGFEAFFAGGASQRLEKDLRENFSGPVQLVQTEVASLECGATGIFRLNSSAFVKASSELVARASSARVDEVIVFFDLVPCQSE